MTLRNSRFLLAIGYGGLGCLSALTAGVPSAFYGLVAIGAFLALWSVIQMLRSPEEVSIFALFRLSVLWGYAFGPALAILFWNPMDSVSPVLLAGEFAFTGYEWNLSYALGSAYWVAGILTIVDGASKSFVYCSANIPKQRAFNFSDRIILTLLMFLLLLAVWTGDLGYMGIQVSSEGNITVLGALAGVIAPALMAVLAYGISQSSLSRTGVIVFLFLLFVTAAIVLVMGRRVLLFGSLVSLIFVFWARPELRHVFSVKRIVASWRPLIVGLLSGALILGGMFAFFALRLATDELGDDSALSERLALASRVSESRSVLHDFYSYASEQSRARSGTLIGYLGALETSEVQARRYGDCMIEGFLNAIPSVLLQSKKHIMRQYDCTDENLNARYSLSQIDSPSTPLTRGYGDFGFAGLLIYPLIIAALLTIAGVVIGSHRSFMYRVFAIAVLMNAAVFVEQSIAFYFAALREIVILAVIATGIRQLDRLLPCCKTAVLGLRASP